MALVWKYSLILTLVHLVTAAEHSPAFGFGVLVAQISDTEVLNFCIKYYPQLYNLTTNRSEAVLYNLDTLDYLIKADTCNKDDPNIPADLKGRFAFVPITSENKTSDSNCTIAERAEILAARNAVGILADGPLTSKFNVTDYEATIAVAALYSSGDKDFLLELQKSHKDAKFFLYVPPDVEKRFDMSLVLILSMAVFTVGVGAIWSGYTKNHLLREQESKHERSRTRVREENDDEERICAPEDERSRISEELSLRVTPIFIIVFVFCMCSMLVLLYFFFDKLVYVIIGMFCLASVMAIYSCFEPLVMWSYKAAPNCPTIKIPKMNLYLCVLNMELRQFLLMCIAISITVVWVVYRKADWAWALQDTLGVLFSLNMLKTLRLPSLKIITILLSTLFIYDIFFVFVTPLITKDGKSVMVEVATGGNTGEQLPMVLKVPHFSDEPMMACYNPYSMLGFGDILVPGLLISFCHAFDLQKGSRCWTYWFTTTLCYTLGMGATFISLFVMNSAQPALLYLVPFTLIPLFVVAGICGDFGAMWKGDYQPLQDQQHQNKRNSAADAAIIEEVEDANLAQAAIAHQEDQEDVEEDFAQPTELPSDDDEADDDGEATTTD